MAGAQDLLQAIPQRRRSWLNRAASLAVMCMSIFWACFEGVEVVGALLAFLISLVCAFLYLSTGARLWSLAGLGFFSLSLVLLNFLIGDFEETALIFLLFLVLVVALLILLLPVSLVFYVFVSHFVFQRRDLVGCVGCIALGFLLGLVNGLLQSFFGWDLERVSGLSFPIVQGVLLGLSFHVFHRMNLFEEGKWDR
jgi:hypothetical protein